MGNRIDDSFGNVCRERNYFWGRKDIIDKNFYCGANSLDCKYIIKNENEEKLCGFYYLEDWKKQRTFEDRLKDLRLEHLKEYVDSFGLKFIDYLFNRKKVRKYKIALKILERRQTKWDLKQYQKEETER